MARETPDALKVSSWSELLEAPYQGSWNPQIARYRLNLAFRGTAQAHYSLETSLSRLVAGRSYDLEAHILRAFRKYAYMLVGVSAAMFVLLGEVMMTRYAGDTRGSRWIAPECSRWSPPGSAFWELAPSSSQAATPSRASPPRPRSWPRRWESR